MGDVRFVWRPIDRWPRAQTVDRGYPPFRHADTRRPIGWTETRPELERELRQLGVRDRAERADRDRGCRLPALRVPAGAQASSPGRRRRRLGRVPAATARRQGARGERRV